MQPALCHAHRPQLGQRVHSCVWRSPSSQHLIRCSRFIASPIGGGGGIRTLVRRGAPGRFTAVELPYSPLLVASRWQGGHMNGGRIPRDLHVFPSLDSWHVSISRSAAVSSLTLFFVSRGTVTPPSAPHGVQRGRVGRPIGTIARRTRVRSLLVLGPVSHARLGHNRPS